MVLCRRQVLHVHMPATSAVWARDREYDDTGTPDASRPRASFDAGEILVGLASRMDDSRGDVIDSQASNRLTPQA